MYPARTVAPLAWPWTVPMACMFGAVMTTSFAPSGAWWLTPFCMAGLFMVSAGRTPLRAAWLGLAFGLGWFGTGVWWLRAGLAAYTEAGPLMALLCTIALASVLALFPAVASSALAALVARRPGMARGPGFWCAGAALWTLAEWGRANLFGGFPWLQCGTAHASAPLGALAPWAGVLGVGWANAFIALVLADCLSRRRGTLLLVAVLSMMTLACCLLQLQHWTAPTGQRLTVRLIQGNIPQFQKVTPVGLADAARLYSALARTSSADLTLLPETALPLAWDAIPAPVLQEWRAIARTRDTALVIGTFGTHAGKPVGNNSGVALLPRADGVLDYRYDKVHLVPFGEQTWPWSVWVTDRLYRRFGALAPGALFQPPLVLDKGRVSIGICFESLFDTATAIKARDAGMLVNLTNFGWFDGTWAAAQHLQAGQMRARETGRWFVQVSNSGGTAIVDPGGVVQSALAPEITGVLDGDVTMMQGITPFMRFGNTPLLATCVLVLVLAFLGRHLFPKIH